ncbi:MAG: DUF3363 domain-containing protein [bacterium]|nr:DUF3363 domain-containing protein [bacterium]
MKKQIDFRTTNALSASPLEANYSTTDDFEARLGNGRSRSGRSLLSTLRLHRKSASAATGKTGRVSNRGRGGVTNLRSYGQRVLVKGRYFKTEQGQTSTHIRAHVSYLARSGVGRDGQEVEFLTTASSLNRQGATKEVASWANDSHHFRFIISPERGFDLDLEDYARSVMKRVSEDLGTSLQWIVACHHNTDNPHCHVLLRGVDESGRPLILSRDYVRQGFRQTAELEATVRLGRVSELEVADRLDRNVQELCSTSIDWRLEREEEESPEGIIRIRAPHDNAREWQKRIYVASVTRLHFLHSRGLAKRVGSDGWKLKPGMRNTLRELGQRQEIESRFGEKLVSLGLEQPLEIHSDSNVVSEPFLGEVVGRGVFDELSGSSFLLVSADDGNTHYIPLNEGSEAEGFYVAEGAIVEIVPVIPTRRADKVIAREAEKQGVFDLAKFRDTVESEYRSGQWKVPEGMSLERYVGLYEKRAETLAEHDFITRKGYGLYEVPANLLAKVSELDQKLGITPLIEVRVKSHHSLSSQVSRMGATWLDQMLAGEVNVPSGMGMFSRAVENSLAERTQVRSSSSVLELQAAEIRELSKTLSQRYGRFMPMNRAGQETYSLVGYELLSDGYYMVLSKENKAEFSLRKVPGLEGRFEDGSKLLLKTSIHRGTGRAVSRAELVKDTDFDRRRQS